MNERRSKIRLAWLVAVALLVTVLSPFIGMKFLSLSVIGGDGVDSDIFWTLRLPRSLLGFLAGAGLAASGMVFQSLFRNALATPFTLGVSSGASLGAALYLIAALPASLAGFSGVSTAAFLGAILSVLLVWGLSRRGSLPPGAMLLAGAAVSFCFSSALLVVHYAADMTHSFRIFHWLIGSLDAVGMKDPLRLVPFLMVGLGLAVFRLRELDLFLLGEELAASRGVNTAKVRFQLFFAVSLMVGGVVSVCGPIGFIGMMVPHACRLWLGPNHRYLFPGSMVAGGAFLALCDAGARWILAPAEVPVGVVTALLGGPFFLWLLVSRKGLNL